MGLFLSMSGIIGVSADVARDALGAYAKHTSILFEPAGTVTEGPDIGAITREGQNTTILYPPEFMEWDEASQFLSDRLAAPVFSLHIHDGDLWMYILFNHGEEVDWFNPVPEYWQANLPEEEKSKWKGDPELVAHLVPSLDPDVIRRYYVEWDLEQEEEVKAYSDDRFPLCDCWQVCDFMRRLGLQYPIEDNETLSGDSFRLGRKAPRTSGGASTTDKKLRKEPWWRFW